MRQGLGRRTHPVYRRLGCQIQYLALEPCTYVYVLQNTCIFGLKYGIVGILPGPYLFMLEARLAVFSLHPRPSCGVEEARQEDEATGVVLCDLLWRQTHLA